MLRLLDEQYTKTSFYGVPRMTAWLRRQGHQVNPKRVARLMGVLGLQAVYPKPRLSVPTPDHQADHRVYPYLLRDVPVMRINQVWSNEFQQPVNTPPSSAHWSYETGAGRWGNNEMEDYVSDLEHAHVVADPAAKEGKALLSNCANVIAHFHPALKGQATRSEPPSGLKKCWFSFAQLPKEP